MPLCSACMEHFTFSRPDIVEQIKATERKSLEYAVSYPGRFPKSTVDYLRDDLEWYERQATTADVPLSPFFDVNTKFDSAFYRSKTTTRIRVWAGRSYGEIQSSPGCQMCVTLLSMAQYHAKGREINNKQIGTYWFLSIPSCRPVQLQVIVSKPGGRDWFEIFVMYPNIDSSGNDIIPNHPRIPNGSSTENQSCINFLHQTLSDCLASHPSCASAPGDFWAPTRLLDVGPSPRNSTDSIVLLDRHDIQQPAEGRKVQYFTLSHIWGKSLPATLTQENYSDRKKCIKLDELPLCFRDAVKMTRSLGGRYLWIDALCIIQDSDDDWASEAACMDKVYINGVCNLAACDIVDSNDSLFSYRQYPQSGATIIHRQEFIKPAYTQNVTFTLMPDWPTSVWEMCNLYRRAWVSQERWLRRRIIHFSQFPIWECSTHLIMEGIPPDDKSTVHSDDECLFPKQRRGWLFATDDDAAVIHRWWEVLRCYGRASLTFNTDKLVAISGIAKTFASLLGNRLPYYAGIWGGKHFPQNLLWRTKSLDFRGRFDDEGYIAPSWSWASTNGEVCMETDLYILRSLAELVSCRIIPKTNDIFGQLTGGELVLKGTLLRLQDTNKRAEWKTFSLYFDHKPSNREVCPEDLTYFLPLAEFRASYDPTTRRFGGLFLKLAKENLDSDHPRYERAGCLPHTWRWGSCANILDSEQWDILSKLPSLEAGMVRGELVTII